MVTRMTNQNGLDLRAIRRASGLSIQEMADSLGLAHRTRVNDAERQKDLLLSTVVKFITAAGGSAKLVVEVGGEVLEFPLYLLS